MADRKKGLFIGIAVSGSFLLVFVAAELAVRLFSSGGFVTPEIQRERGLDYEPALFARHVFPRRERIVDVADGRRWQMNSLGYRGPEFEAEKPDGVLRIMVFGGSAVFDQEATLGQDWPRRVETLLRERGFGSVEVINAGIPGHASFDSFGRLFAEGHRFQPDVVVLYNAWNDIKLFRWTQPLLRELRPYDAHADPRLNYRNNLDAWLCRVSQVYVRIRARYYNWALDLGVEGIRASREIGSDLDPQAVRQYRLAAELFVDAARNIGARPVLVTQARLVSAGNSEEQRERIAYEMVGLDHRGLVDAFAATDRALRRVADEKNAVLIDASARLSGRPQWFHDHVHFSPEGSAALAEVVADAMAPLLLAR